MRFFICEIFFFFCVFDIKFTLVTLLLILKCGERAVSREDIFKSSPSHHLSFDRRSHERDMRIRPISYRARSEERTTFVKDWGLVFN